MINNVKDIIATIQDDLAQWDGVVPIHRSRNIKEYLSVKETKEILRYIKKYRELDTPFDFCVSGILPAKKLSEDRNTVEAYEKAGATWWIEFVYSRTGSVKRNTERIRFGPPR